jgi:hypothetical protein
MFKFASLLALTAGLSSAGTLVYSCASTVTKCDGNLYAISASNPVGNTWDLFVDIKVTSGYTGTQFTDAVGALSIDSFATSPAGFSLLSNPGGTPWTLLAGGLDAGGCNGHGNGFECVFAPTTASDAKLVSAGTILEWEFQFTTTSLTQTGCTQNTGDIGCLDIKYQYVNANGDKVGDLGSYEMNIQPGDGTGTIQSTTPEPASMLLIGAGLLGVALLGKVRRT